MEATYKHESINYYYWFHLNLAIYIMVSDKWLKSIIPYSQNSEENYYSASGKFGKKHNFGSGWDSIESDAYLILGIRFYPFQGRNPIVGNFKWGDKELPDLAQVGH